MSQRILVWDIPTRVFHWSFALSFAGAYLTAESEHYRHIHLALGYLFLGLLGFRLVWGIAGTAYARFRNFIFTPTQIQAYLRSLLQKQPQHYVGHNPAGGIAIFLLLAAGLLVGVSGLVLDWQASDGGWWEEMHETTAALALALVCVHIAGVFVSSALHRENLARAMLTGYKQAETGQGIAHAYTWLGVLMLAAMASFLGIYLAA